MKNILLLCFFLMCQLTSNGQEVDITGEWLLSNMTNIKFSFSENNQLSVQHTKSDMSFTTKTFKLIREDRLIYLFENKQPFDTLEIINLEQDILTIYQRSILDTLDLLDCKKTVSRNDYKDFIRTTALDYYSPYLEGGIGYKRYNSYLSVKPESNCCETLMSGEPSSFLNVIFGGFNEGPFSKISFWPKTITNDTLIGLILPDKIDVKMVRNRTVNNSSHSLIGTWIVMDDKVKFDASLKKESKTIYIGQHKELKILPENKCNYSRGDLNSTGIVHLENIEGINVFKFRSEYFTDASMRKDTYGFFSEIGNLTIFNETHMALNTLYCPDDKYKKTELYFIKLD